MEKLRTVRGVHDLLPDDLHKHKKVRAALCWNEEIAKLAKQHNNANIVCIPARFISKEEALQIVKSFIDTKFEGGRHERRVNKI